MVKYVSKVSSPLTFVALVIQNAIGKYESTLSKLNLKISGKKRII